MIFHRLSSNSSTDLWPVIRQVNIAWLLRATLLYCYYPNVFIGYKPENRIIISLLHLFWSVSFFHSPYLLSFPIQLHLLHPQVVHSIKLNIQYNCTGQWIKWIKPAMRVMKPPSCDLPLLQHESPGSRVHRLSSVDCRRWFNTGSPVALTHSSSH